MRFFFPYPRFVDGRFFLGATKGFRALRDYVARGGHETQVLSFARVNAVMDAKIHASPGDTVILGTEVTPVHALVVPDDFFSDMERYGEILQRFEGLIDARIRQFAPDWIVMDHSASPNFLDVALSLSPGNIALTMQNPQWLGFGPFGVGPPDSRLSEPRKLVAVSQFVHDYLAEHGGLSSIIQPYLAWEPPFPDLGCFERKTVMLINPCDFKGSGIFLGLAQSFPDVSFIGVRTWGGIDQALTSQQNITIIEPNSSMDLILARASVLIVPSLWAEAFGMVAVDAMLRGIPVLGSNLGGLPEALLGVGEPIDVEPIRFEAGCRDFRERIVPVQEIRAWCEALAPLLTRGGYYRERSSVSRRTALAYVRGLSAEPLVQGLASAR